MNLGATEKKLLSRLQKNAVLAAEDLARAEQHAVSRGGSLRAALLDLALLKEHEVARHYARANGADFLDLEQFEPNILVLEYLAPSQARRYRAIPVGLIDETLVVAVDDMDDVLALDELRNLIPRTLRIALATRTAVAVALDKYFPSGDQGPRPATERRSSDHRHAQLSASDLRRSSGEIAKPRILPGEPLAGRPTRVVSLSDIETVMEKEDSDRAALMVARTDDYVRRGGRSSLDHETSGLDDDPGPKGDAPPPADRRVEEMLRAIMETALLNRAEEIEFPVPVAEQTRTRLRRDGTWHDAMPYTARYHDSLVERLRQLAGIERHAIERAVEAHFLLESRRGRIPTIACFTPTTRGVRCVLRFPENTPLIQAPFRALGLEDTVGRDLDRRLGGEGGGLLLVTAGMARLAHQLYASILLDQAGRGRSVHSIEWTLDRRLPGVVQVEARTVEAILAAIDHAATEAPELIGLSAIPTGDVVGRLVDLGGRGQATIGCLTAPTAAHGLAALRAARTDALALTLGVVAHVHVARVPRLCPSCAAPVEERRLPRALPKWAGEMDPALFREATGCPVCAGTGRKGVHWVCDVSVPSTAGDGALGFVARASDRLRDLVARGEASVADLA